VEGLPIPDQRKSLNERLLPKEQRPGIVDDYVSVGPPSMKGCSRKSSDPFSVYSPAIPASLNERLLPKEQRPPPATMMPNTVTAPQ